MKKTGRFYIWHRKGAGKAGSAVLLSTCSMQDSALITHLPAHAFQQRILSLDTLLASPFWNLLAWQVPGSCWC